ASSNGKHRIWTRLMSGGTSVLVTKDDTDHYGPRWFPDSNSLLYYAASNDSDAPGMLYEIPALGGAARRLENALGPGDVSHDGRSIAYLRFKDGAIELATAAADLTTTRSITKLPPANYSNVRWSPDDRHIAVLQSVGGASFSTNVLVANVTAGSVK